MAEIPPVLRALRPDEASHGYAVYLQAFAWLEAKGIRQWLIRYPEEKFMARVLRGESFGLFVGGEVAVILALALESSPYWLEATGPNPVWWLSTIATASQFRGRQLGRYAINAAVRRLSAAGADVVFLDCVDNRGALPALYQQEGFAALARKPIRYPSGNTFPMVLMQRTVPRYG